MTSLPTPSEIHWGTDLVTAGQFYKAAKDFGVMDRLKKKLLSGKTRIAITGASGVGKTVLFDHLVGKAPSLEYAPPGRSLRTEEGRTRREGKKLHLVVVPGGRNNPRSVALNELFDKDGAVDGVIHVVCNGFIPLRESETSEQLSRDGLGTLSAYLSRRRGDEMDEFEEVLGYIRRAHAHQNAKPKWMLIAVAKYDLYADAKFVYECERPDAGGGSLRVQKELTAMEYYASDAESPFVKLLDGFRRHVGGDKFSVETLPVTTFLETFQWPEVVNPALDEPKRNAYLHQFMTVLEKHCG